MRLAGPYRACHYVITQATPRKRLLRPLRALPFSTYLSSREAHILDEATFQPRPQPNPQAKNIAVLGGGISGLGAAYDIARTIPDAKITIYEQSDRVGGWIDSEVIEVDGGEALFEWGPRSLRPDIGGPGTATVNMLLRTGLHEHVIGIRKSHPAATNRFIYYPDHLVRMPLPKPGSNVIANIISGLYMLFTEPIFKGVPGSLLAEPSVRTRSSDVKDESIGEFLRRRFGPAIADNLASALFHGIYAGDIYQLSARTLLPSLWYLETRDPDGNGILPEMADLGFKRNVAIPYKNIKFHNMVLNTGEKVERGSESALFIENLNQCSVYTFTQGLQMLPQKLEEILRADENVTIKTSSPVSGLTFDPEKSRFDISCNSDSTPPQYDYVVSTLGPSLLADFFSSSAKSRQTTPDSDLLKCCTWSDKSVNVMVVNFYYTSPNIISSNYRGFGYLIPRSVPLEQNPERALGVIFSSETSGPNGEAAIQEIPRLSIEDISSLKTLLEGQVVKMATKLDLLQTQKGDAAADMRRSRIEKEMRKKLDDIKERLAKIEDETKDDLSKPRSRRVGQDTAPGTKLTVMMGGHWWDGWKESDLPSEDEAIQMAKDVLERHLKISEQPLVAKARLQRSAIPQYQPHYRDAMATIHKGLMSEFKGRLKVAGPWWQGGVGVNDCMKKARETAFAIREEWDENTGLEEYTKKEEWCLLDGRTGTVTIDPMSE